MAMVQQQVRVVVPEHEWRRAVKRLGSFTVSELAAELGCSQRTARDHIEQMAALDTPLVRANGRYGRKPMYAYIKPEDAGERFHRQQALRQGESEADVADLAAVRNGEVRQSRLDSIPNKEIKSVCREAIAQGWRLAQSRRTGHAFDLVKEGRRPIAVPTSPRSAGNAAQIIRQQLGGNTARFRRAG